MSPSVCLKYVSILLLLSVGCYSINIKTGGFMEVYSGPGGITYEPWDTEENGYLFDHNIAVAEFLFSIVDDYRYYGEVDYQEVFLPPTITVLYGSDVVEPVLEGDAAYGYTFDSLNYSDDFPELYVFFNCKKEGNANMKVTVHSSIYHNEEGHTTSSNETIEYFFSKNCHSNGFREGFSIGYGPDKTNNVVNHGHVQSRWDLDSYEFIDLHPAFIPDTEDTSTFSISMNSDSFGNQDFYAPILHVEDDDLVEASLRGSNAMNGGIAISREPRLLNVVYKCKQSGSTEITISISLGFFGTLTFGFTKQCAYTDDIEEGIGGVINVGISRNDYAGIVMNSVTSLFWSMDDPVVKIDADDIATNFYVSTLSGKRQEILKPIISINPPTAFRHTVSSVLRDGGVVTGSPQHFTVNYICSKVTTATVLVTIKPVGFDPVEFAYTKQCRPPKRQGPRVWTANQLMIAFVFFSVVIGTALYLLYKRNNPNPRKSSHRKAEI